MSCEICEHRCCVNGESGICIIKECEICRNEINVCSNELTNEQIRNRCNGEACGCGDISELVCNDCRK